MPSPNRLVRPLYAVATLLAIAGMAALWLWVQVPSAGAALTATTTLVALVMTLMMARMRAPADAAPQAGSAAGKAEPLEATREESRLANRAAQMGQWEWQLGDDRLWWSPELCELYGVQPPQSPATMREALALVHPDDHRRWDELAAQARSGGSVPPIQFRIKRPDGCVRMLAADATAVVPAEGDVVIHGVQRDVTELTDARRRLQLAEAQYRFLFEHSPMSMWVFDRDTQQLLAVNEEVVRQHGYEPENGGSAPLSMQDFSRSEEAGLQEALRHAASTQGGAWTYERSDGTTVQAALYSQELEFDGRPATLVAMQDTTEQQRTDNLYQLVAAATSDGIYEWDLTRNALWLSDSFFTAFGYDRTLQAPTIGLWKSRIHPDDVSRVMASLAAAANGNTEEWEAEYALQRGDGSFSNVLHRGFFLRDRAGRASRMVGGLIDLTESRRVAADLRLLRRAVESARTGIVITEVGEQRQPIVYVNSGFEAITGYSAEEVIGRGWRFLQGDERDQAAVAAIRNAISEEKELRVTLRNLRKGGQVFWADVHLSPLRNPNGELTHYLSIITDVTDRHHYEEQLAYRATHDDLTGLPNRQLVIDRLGHAIASARRRNGTVTVLFVDIDNFKIINDTMGHATGDAVLTTMADRIAGMIRGTDTAGRFGGDEFVLVLEEQESPRDVEQVIERVVRALRAPLDIGGTSHVLTVSIGYCSYPEDGGTADALLLHADIAMYHAKRRGRNRAVAYSTDLYESDSTQLQLIARLRQALHRDEFSLVFQPLFLPSGKAVALEALIRWDHPEKGRLPPAYFIGACEESGLILELERSVLASAAKYHDRLAAAGLGEIRIAVNVSSSHFVHDLYSDVETVVNQFGLPPGSLELELTESVIMENPESAIATMTRLAALGVSTTVDDFGTGYSSLAYLKRLPVARVKIDRAFVRDLSSDLSDRSICESIISLARSMDLRTVAEGVETDFQLGWLKDHGVDEFQGFLLGRPVPFDEVLELLSRQK